MELGISFVALSLILGMIFAVFIRLRKKKNAKGNHVILDVMLGPLALAGLSIIWYGMTGSTLLGDPLESLRIYAAVGGVSLVCTVYNTLNERMK